MVNLKMSSHFWPNNPIEEIYIIEATLKMSAHFWSNVPIEVNLQLRALFLTILSFLTKVANFKENDSCPVCFDANFAQNESCARSFSQALASKQYGPIWKKTAFAQFDLMRISRNRKVVPGVFHRLWLPNNGGQLEGKRRLRRVFWRHFRAAGQLRKVF